MSKVEIVLDTKEIGKLLRSKEMLEEMTTIAKKKATANTHIKSFVGFDRAKAIIYPNTKENPR